MWKNIVPMNIVFSFYQMDLDVWISLNINKKIGNGLDWRYFWATECYFIWIWHNKY